MAVRKHWTVVTESCFWLNLQQVLACGLFKLDSHCYIAKNGGVSVWFDVTCGDETLEPFSIYRNEIGVGDQKTYWFIEEQDLTTLATLAAIDSLLGDVVPES